MQILNQYRTEGSGKYLSASAINHYINCPLAFYFEKVEKLNVPDEMMEFMDAGTLGTVVHTVLQEIYLQYGKNTHEGTYVDDAVIDRILVNDEALQAKINETINRIYLHKPDCPLPLTGETVIIATGILMLVKRLLGFEKGQSFTILQTEKEETYHWHIDDEVCVNIKQFIDRVDRIDDCVNSCIRIIDYKTGNDNTTTSSVSMMFNGKSQSRAKAMLQLMLYCNVYAAIHNPNVPLKPIIYKIRKITDSNFRVNRKTVENYAEINEEYMQLLKQVIKDIFDPSVPFKQTENENNCLYCKFTDFCRK